MNAQTIESDMNNWNDVQHLYKGRRKDQGKANKVQYENQIS